MNPKMGAGGTMVASTSVEPADGQASPRRTRMSCVSGGRRVSFASGDQAPLFEAAQHGDARARAQLVESHVGLARTVANRFVSPGRSLEDLHQVAMLGLLKAIDRFDPGRGLRFSTFAWTAMSGEVRRYLRDTTWRVHVTRRTQELFLEVAGTRERLIQQLGRSPTVGDVAQAVGVNERDVAEAVEAGMCQRLTSLDAEVEGAPDSRLQVGEDDDELDRVDNANFLSPLVARLPLRERRILSLRFGAELTQAEIADRLGISQMHVSRLLSRALAQLRSWAESAKP